MPVIKIKEIDAKTFGLYVNNRLIGTSKTDSDARLHMHFLVKLFQKVYDKGCFDGSLEGY